MTTPDQADEEADLRRRVEALHEMAQADRIAITDDEVAELVALLDDETTEVRRYAARTLAHLSYGRVDVLRPAVDELVDALADDDRYVRIHSADALASIGEHLPDLVTRGIPALVAIACDLDTHRWVRESVLRSFSEMAAERPALFADHVDHVAARLDDPQEGVPREAAAVVAAVAVSMGDRERLFKLLDHAPAVREGAMDAVAAMASAHPGAVASVRPTVVDALDDDAAFVRKYALRALCRLAQQDTTHVQGARAAVRSLLDDDVHFVQKEAFETFGHVGTSDDADTVRSHRESVSGDVQAVADDCLRRLRGADGS